MNVTQWHIVVRWDVLVGRMVRDQPAFTVGFNIWMGFYTFLQAIYLGSGVRVSESLWPLSNV